MEFTDNIHVYASCNNVQEASSVNFLCANILNISYPYICYSEHTFCKEFNQNEIYVTIIY